METNIKNYGKIIDQLRKDRQFTRADLVDNIMSQRNYQRFVTGEVSISNEKLLLLVDRMSVEFTNVNQFITSQISPENSRFFEAFESYRRLDYEDALIKIYSIDKDTLKLKSAVQKYNYIESSSLYALGKITESEFVNRIHSAINYPQILNYKTINVVELNSLVALNGIQTRNKSREVSDYLSELLKHYRDNILGWESYKAPIIYASIARGYFRLGEYELCYNHCNKGIELSKLADVGFAIVNLFSYKALALNKMMKFSEAIDCAIKVYMILLIDDNEEKYRVYTKILNDSLNIKLEDLVQIKKGT